MTENLTSAPTLPSTKIDRDIYPMPMFPTFQVTDLSASVRWYVEAAGFVVLAELPRPAGPSLVHLRRFRYQDQLLVPAREPASTPRGAGVRIGYAAGDEDLSVRAEVASGVAGGDVEGPIRQPWNALDVVLRDPDGYEIVLTQPLPFGEQDEAFSETVRASVRR